LIYVAKYNGEANDKDVEISLVRSPGIYADIGCDGGLRGREAGSPTARPKLDGKPVNAFAAAHDNCDRWLVDTLVPESRISGYVNDHILVAKGADSTVAPILVGSEVQIDLRAPLIVGRIGRVEDAGAGGGVVLSDVVLGGRMPIKALLPFVGAQRLIGTALCKSPTLYRSISQQLCMETDLKQRAELDDETQRCDTLSLALRLVPERVLPTSDAGGITFVSGATDCPDGSLFDSCEGL
jgi:hypothetical protein